MQAISLLPAFPRLGENILKAMLAVKFTCNFLSLPCSMTLVQATGLLNNDRRYL
jgi:hypothetical protein